MMFSIVIPLYNKAEYVECAVNSVLMQSYTQWELIVVDDGSTDNSVARVRNLLKRSLVDSHIRLLHQQNSGVSTARNNGEAIANGDYICFLDADDWWTPTYLEEIAQLIATYPDAGIYGSSYYIVKNGKNKAAPIAVDKDFTNGYIDYIKVYSKYLCMPLWTGAVALKKSIFEEMNGFRPQLKLGEDFDLWLRIALKYKVAFVNKPLAYYNQDVELKHRALGHLYLPQQHELSYYADYEKTYPDNPDLKRLLDNKRVYLLWPYFLSKQYHGDAVKELANVDWSKRPISLYKKYYKYPLWWLQMRNWIVGRLYGMMRSFSNK